VKYKKPQLHDLTSPDSGRGLCVDGSGASQAGGVGCASGPAPDLVFPCISGSGDTSSVWCSSGASDFVVPSCTLGSGAT